MTPSMVRGMLRGRLLFFCLLLLSLHASADGLYEIRGTHPERGEYSGQAWVHDSQAQRIIRWKTYRHDSYSVENVWSGSATEQELRFSLRLSNTLTALNGYEPTPLEIQNSIPVSIPFATSQNKPEANVIFSVPTEGGYRESWTRIADAPPVPLWKDLREIVDGTGDDKPWYYEILLWLGIDQVIDWYRALPAAIASQDREEYRSQRQYFITDKTDADFYASQPQVLRVTNKTLNPLSLAEASMRRNAYAPTLSEKAEYLRSETLKYNLNESGLLEFAIVNDNGAKLGRSPEYDSALWTAMFGWSELMRYQATHDAEALTNFRRMLNGILTLIEITDDSTKFARTLAISPLTEDLGPGWIQGKGRFSHLKWRSGGNNDMIKGVFLMLTLAHQVIRPDEAELRARITAASQSILKIKAISRGAFNSGIAHGLIALWSDRAEEKDDELQAFSHRLYNLKTILANAVQVNGNFYYGGVADWSGIHLTLVSSLCQILLARELKDPMRNSQYAYLLSGVLKSGEAQLLEMHKTYKKAHRDFLTLFAYAFSPQAKTDERLLNDAKDALWTLKEIPAPRSLGTAEVDLSKLPEWSLSAWPRVPWKGLTGVRKIKHDLDFENFVQGAYSYPIFEAAAWDSDYLWKENPFTAKYNSHPRVATFSADYLILYWVARSAGLLAPAD